LRAIGLTDAPVICYNSFIWEIWSLFYFFGGVLMNFQGKAVLVYLEEDNIARAYFRVQPLMTQDGPLGPVVSDFPDDGFLRIVPDKNEQHTFKERMRTLIGLCLVDLRFFPTDANKIRTNKNYAPALLKLGQIYIEGKGTDKRPIAAADYFERAYNLGNIKAAVELGICYANGEGVELDYEKAFELHRAAAYAGNAEGAYNLGLCYYYGAGTAKDMKMAKDWLEDAAKKGSSEAKQAVKELF